MPTNSRPSSARTVHVHGAEVSTDRESLGDYAEMLAVLVAACAILAASWIAAEPRPNADIAIPAPPSPVVEDFVRTSDSTQDVIAPDVDASLSTAVTTVDPEPAGAQ